MKKFSVAILVPAIVLLSATLATAGSKGVFTHSYDVNTAPAGFTCTNNCTVTSPSTPGDCAVDCTWTPITTSSWDGEVESYELDVTAHYVSPPGLTCPADTVLRQTIEVPAFSSDCSTTSCTATIDLTDSVGLTGYKVVSFDASVTGNIRTDIREAMRASPSVSLSLPNGAASIFKASPNPCATP